MNSKSNISLLIIKLAGIGDVTTACRAFNETLGRTTIPATIHWAIDPLFIPLAKQLIKSSPLVTHRYHAISSKSLFQGSFLSKGIEAMRLSFLALRLQPISTLLLHRDTRYAYFLRPVTLKSFFQISERSKNELTVYKDAFLNIISRLNITLSDAKPEESDVKISGIGILLGGGKGTKITYDEKRWTFWPKLIEMILSNTSEEVVLFGSADDFEDSKNDLQPFLKNPRLHNKVGTLRLEQIPDELKSLKAFISVDTGLHHIAATVMMHAEQKVVAIFGPTDPRLWGALPSEHSSVKFLYQKLPCSPCYHNDGNFKSCIFKDDQYKKCMNTISAEEVFKHIFPQSTLHQNA